MVLINSLWLNNLNNWERIQSKKDYLVRIQTPVLRRSVTMLLVFVPTYSTETNKKQHFCFLFLAMNPPFLAWQCTLPWAAFRKPSSKIHSWFLLCFNLSSFHFSCSQFHLCFTSAFFVWKFVLSQTLSREKLLKRLLYKKGARKTLIKSTTFVFNQSFIQMVTLIWPLLTDLKQW